MLGIDNIKTAVIAAINFGEKIEKNLADDGKISLTEALGIGATSFTDIMKIVKSGKEIKDEFLDLDDLEKEELIDLVKEELDLENDKVEVIIETAVEFLAKLGDLINSFKSE